MVKEERHCTYKRNIKARSRTTVAIEKQQILHIPSVVM